MRKIFHGLKSTVLFTYEITESVIYLAIIKADIGNALAFQNEIFCW